jgi:Mg/Co/Ni transporter MgtE
MEATREFKDDENRKVKITIQLTDDEIIDMIAKKSMDERIVFFRKLFQTDVKKVLTFNFIKQFI